ncbi:MAG: zinc-dependent metalloprotease, partial [Ilumatobacteraceae bacterium]
MAEGDPGNPFGDNPFGGIPLFGDLAKALAGQGPLNWDAARQFAQLAASGGASEANVDPAVRIALSNLARIAEMHVRDVTGLDPVFPEITPVTPSAWAQRTLDAYRPLFTELATSLGQRPQLGGSGGAGDDPSNELDVPDGADQMMAMMANLSSMMAPSMMGMAVGSMVGRMATRAFGQYDLPIPRNDNSLLL